MAALTLPPWAPPVLPARRPPELLADGLLSKATDVYALGVLVWEMYCGRHAWAGHSPARIIYAVTCAGERLALPPGAHPPLAALLDACLQTDHTKRPSCAEIEAALGAMVAAL
jgi:serine/threonine protein kinase